MTSLPRARTLILLIAASLLVAVFAAHPGAHLAYADAPVADGVKKAGKHFQRGVALYNEADYRAALVEFRRAYETAPNPVVLYNIGQTYYQLQSYAQALTTFERYLVESGESAAHRKEVDDTVDILRSRVGKLQVAVNLDGCQVTVDDELVGETPIREPVLVSIGRRKVIAMCEGRSAETRVVEVAAGDLLEMKIFLAPNLALSPAAESGARARSTGSDSGRSAATWRKVGWIATGALAAGTIATGVLALIASSDLEDERKTYPSSLEALDDKSSKLRKFSLAADILGASTVIVGGVTLTLTLTRSRSRSPEKVQLSVGPTRMSLSGTFW
jgi:tetratricopeptide (TPR) repeat protein